MHPSTADSVHWQMLTVNEIFHSIQGESTFAGEPCVFVRLTACDLRCCWCDTPYAFHEGRKMSIDEVLAEVERYGCPLVEVTGGEPLLQPDVYPLMTACSRAARRCCSRPAATAASREVPAGRRSGSWTSSVRVGRGGEEWTGPISRG